MLPLIVAYGSVRSRYRSGPQHSSAALAIGNTDLASSFSQSASASHGLQPHNNTGRRGLVAQYDVVCFDEVAGIKFDQKVGVNILKGYMEAGEFSRGRESIRAEGFETCLIKLGLNFLLRRWIYINSSGISVCVRFKELSQSRSRSELTCGYHNLCISYDPTLNCGGYDFDDIIRSIL